MKVYLVIQYRIEYDCNENSSTNVSVDKIFKCINKANKYISNKVFSSHYSIEEFEVIE